MGEHVGRPPYFKKPEDIQVLVDQYFKDCEGRPLLDENGQVFRDKDGEVIFLGARPPTVTGLALALGFHSRQSLLNYQGKPSFMDTITRAKSRVEAYAEERLFDREGARGAEFTLKFNFRWDKGHDEDDSGDGEGGVVLIPTVMDEDSGESSGEKE